MRMPPGLVNQRSRIADKIGQSFLAGTERHRSGDGSGHLSHLFDGGQQPARHQRIGTDRPHRGQQHAIADAARLDSAGSETNPREDIDVIALGYYPPLPCHHHRHKGAAGGQQGAAICGGPHLLGG